MEIINMLKQPREILSMAAKSIEGVDKFFQKNPTRRVCKVKFWDGVIKPVRRKHVAEDIMKEAKEAIRQFSMVAYEGETSNT